MGLTNSNLGNGLKGEDMDPNWRICEDPIEEETGCRDKRFGMM